MIHRIFLAINLPESAKNKLYSFKEKYPELPARWAPPENLHITLVFYGNASDAELEDIKDKTKEISKNFKPFALKLSKIVYGPDEKNPRMIWAAGETTKELLVLQQELANSLNRAEKRAFSLHITLARFSEWEFKRIEPEERPEINEEISIEVPVNSIEIMESKLKRGGAEYSVVESYPLTL